MAHVIVEIKMWIVDPDCMFEKRDLVKALTVTRDEMQVALGCALDQVYIDSPTFDLEGADIENIGRGDMHSHIALFEKKEGIVLRAQPIIVPLRHWGGSRLAIRVGFDL